MNPTNAMRVNGAFFDWLADYDGSNGKKSAKHFHKRKCRRIIRRDAARDIKEQLDNG